MAGTLTISTLSDGTNSTSSTNCIQGSAKAWVNLNGSGSAVIRGSYNVSSVTYVSGGLFTINFSTAMPNVNYAVAGCASWDNVTINNAHGMDVAILNNTSGAMSTTSVSVITYFGGVRYNPLFLTVAIFSS